MIKMMDLIRIMIVIMMSSIEFQVQLDYSARSSLILIRKGEVNYHHCHNNVTVIYIVMIIMIIIIIMIMIRLRST